MDPGGSARLNPMSAHFMPADGLPTSGSLRLGVLDQSPVPSGSTATDAFENTVDLAQHCERLGYHRYWVSEHHNSDGLAGAAPELLVGRIAAATDSIMVGSGGVMLSHYSPYKVAESFLTLDAMFPGRIELGIGRAPGSDPITMYALADSDTLRPVDRYPNMVRDLLGFLDGDLPEDSPYRGRVRAVPTATGEPPPVWLLSSSPDSASFAAHFGLPLAWAHFFSPANGPEIVEAYKRQYEPSERFPEPIVAIAAGVICADTEAEAAEAASSVQLWRARGLAGPIPSLDDVANAAPNPLAIQSVNGNGRKPMAIGTPDMVLSELEELGAQHGTDDIFVVTITWDHAARVRSYELVARAAGLSGASAAA